MQYCFTEKLLEVLILALQIWFVGHIRNH